jgi:hypothetical protein
MSLAFNNKGDGSQWGLKLNLNMIYVTMWKCKAYLFATKGYSYLTNLTYECGIALIWYWRNQGKVGTFKHPLKLAPLGMHVISYHSHVDGMIILKRCFKRSRFICYIWVWNGWHETNALLF